MKTNNLITRCRPFPSHSRVRGRAKPGRAVRVGLPVFPTRSSAALQDSDMKQRKSRRFPIDLGRFVRAGCQRLLPRRAMQSAACRAYGPRPEGRAVDHRLAFPCPVVAAVQCVAASRGVAVRRCRGFARPTRRDATRRLIRRPPEKRGITRGLCGACIARRTVPAGRTGYTHTEAEIDHQVWLET